MTAVLFVLLVLSHLAAWVCWFGWGTANRLTAEALDELERSLDREDELRRLLAEALEVPR